MEPITKASVEAARSKEPKRICFGTIHKAEPKRSTGGKYTGTFNAPFGDGFSKIFPYELFPNKHDSFHDASVWLSISTEDEFQKIGQWVNHQGDRVFLRDCLYTSIALSHNFCDAKEGERTEIGDLEYRAKQHQDEDAVKALAKHCVRTINDLPLYKDADLVCAVPPKPDKAFDLPSRIASLVSKKLNMEDVTGHFNFGAKKQSVKSASLDDKWSAWENAKLTFSGFDIKDKNIILIDDKYQSGTTIQFIAMKLQEAGAHQIYGLSIVKTMKDTDNQ